jgi:hypothetical protein
LVNFSIYSVSSRFFFEPLKEVISWQS